MKRIVAIWSVAVSSTFSAMAYGQACQLSATGVLPEAGYIEDLNLVFDIEGDWAVLGRPEASRIEVYSYQSGWSLSQPISGPSLETWYGHDVAISEGKIAVGLPGGYAPSAPFNNTRSVYAYSFDGTTWSTDQVIHASDYQASDRFGEVVAMDGDVLAIGSRLSSSSSKLYIFEHDGLDWIESASFALGYPVDYVSPDMIDVDVDRVVVGLFGWDRAEVFMKQGGVWGHEQTIESDLAGEYSYFGNSVSIKGSTLAVGAHEDNSPGGSELGTGAVHIFSLNKSGTWEQSARVLPENPLAQGLFGYSVSLMSSDSFVVGQPIYSSSDDAAYVYVNRQDDIWESVYEMTPSIHSLIYRMGYLVAGDSGKAIVLEMTQNNSLSDAARIHLYDFNPQGCRADLTGDCSTDFFDVSVFLTFYQLKNPIADFSADGEFNFFDISAFLSELSGGCP